MNLPNAKIGADRSLPPLHFRHSAGGTWKYEMANMMSCLKRATVALVSMSFAYGLLAEGVTFKMSTLVVSQPITYSLRQAALTQVDEGMTDVRLVLSVVLRNHVADETFRAGGKSVCAHLEGVSIPLMVPCMEESVLRLGAEDVTCRFSCIVKDPALRDELKQIDRQKAWHKVSVVLSGVDFPIVSETTKLNVLSEMRVTEQKVPTTEIQVGFGDVKRLSPWRVRQRYGRASGRKGLVSLHDALMAVNESVAQDEEMPEHTFAFAADGSLASVCDESFSALAIGADGTIIEEPVGNLLSRPVRDFRKVVFFKEVAKAVSNGGAKVGLSAGETKTIDLPGGAKMEMIWCPAGSFQMGSPASEAGRFADEVPHAVTITKGFWLGKYEVTQAQWQSVMRDEGVQNGNRSRFKGENRPIENVSWQDCQSFIRKANVTLGGVARLPTEAEWEYACRAGTSGPFAGNGRVDDMAWYDGNSGSQTHDVGTKQTNAWGFCDMHGNVLEWCEDWFAKTASGDVDPKGPASGSFRVLRGGSWFYYARDCRSAYRLKRDPNIRNFIFGFRLALSAGENEQ